MHGNICYWNFKIIISWFEYFANNNLHNIQDYALQNSYKYSQVFGGKVSVCSITQTVTNQINMKFVSTKNIF